MKDCESNHKGIYIICFLNNKIYIGKANNFRRRYYSHKSAAKAGKMEAICCAIRKYNLDDCIFRILEYCDNFTQEETLSCERFWIDFHNSTNRKIGYNICKFSNDCTGTKWNDEQRAKQSERLKGRKMTEEQKKNLSTILLASPKNKGKNKGQIQKEETKRKRTESFKKFREQNPMTEETKNKIRQAHLGKKATEAAKKNMSLSHMGRKHSIESKEKMIINSAANKPVAQYDLNGNLIEKFFSMSEVKRKLNFCRTESINKSHNTGKPYNGFLWKFISKEEYLNAE